MLNNSGVSLVVMLKDTIETNFEEIRNDIKKCRFNLIDNWYCEIKNYQNKRYLTLDNFSLI